jgi:protein ImuA
MVASRRELVSELTRRMRRLERAAHTPAWDPIEGLSTGPIDSPGASELPAGESATESAADEVVAIQADVATSRCAAADWPTGTSLDELLPARGWRQGTLVEWLSGGLGAGVWTLALCCCRRLFASGRGALLIDTHGECYPPGLAGLGVPLERLTVVRPGSAREGLWVCEQALRCPGVGVVFGEFAKLDDRSYRRLQLAAEVGGSVGMLLRPPSARAAPAWADVRLQVTPVGISVGQAVPDGVTAGRASSGTRHDNRAVVDRAVDAASEEFLSGGNGVPSAMRRRWRVELFSGRGVAQPRTCRVEFDHETLALRVVSEPTGERRAVAARRRIAAGG